jgi:DNA-binding transcriptional ArsR family regulator
MANGTALTALAALGDPTRRAIFERLLERPSAVGTLAAQLPVSRPAVSQHLRVLKDAGLAIEEVSGARRVYRIDPRGIGAMRRWLDQHWAAALDGFARYVDEVEEQGE